MITTRFAASEVADKFVISFTKDQITNISKTDSIAVTASLNTFATEKIKIRNTDSITLSVGASVTVQTEVNN